MVVRYFLCLGVCHSGKPNPRVNAIFLTWATFAHMVQSFLMTEVSANDAKTMLLQHGRFNGAEYSCS